MLNLLRRGCRKRESLVSNSSVSGRLVGVIRFFSDKIDFISWDFPNQNHIIPDHRRLQIKAL